MKFRFCILHKLRYLTKTNLDIDLTLSKQQREKENFLSSAFHILESTARILYIQYTIHSRRY